MSGGIILKKEVLMPHQLENLISEIDTTHPRLGRLIAMSVIAVKAQQFLLVISPSGCGKSSSSSVIGKTHKDPYPIASVTSAWLMKISERLTGFKGVMLIDDISKINDYEKRDTIVTFATLCHEHHIDKHTMMADYEINEFYGSAVINIQPVMMSQLYASTQWEGLLQDKSLRYYHLFRPTQPQETPPNVDIDWGINIDDVKKEVYRGKIYERLLKIAQIQWSDSRALQHLHLLLRASASLDSRKEVNETDYALLNILMRPMIAERYLFTKTGFEEGRVFDKNLASLIVEFASWSRVDVDRIVRDYKVSPSTAYRLLHSLNGWLELKSGSVLPSESLKKILREIGVRK